MRMPRKARATGIPTAQPTMTGIFDFFSVVGEGPEVLEAGGVKVVTCVWVKVLVPSVPEEMLSERDVMGVGVGVVVALEESLVEESDEAGVDEGEFPSSDTRPVMDARLGALFAVDCPMMAYCWPSPREKKGRGSGDSWQQSTWVLSPSQHH
jgi:hypothetical protein